MNAGDRSSSSGERDDHGTGPRPGETSLGSSSTRATWILGLAGAMAAIVSWGVGEVFYEVIPAQPVLQNISGNQVMIPNMATELVATTRNAALAFGISGLCLAGFLGVAGGIVQGKTRVIVGAGLLGSVLGFVIPAAVCLAMLPMVLRARYLQFEYELAISFAMHSVIWGVIGACAGLIGAIGLGRPGFIVKALLAGFSGALVGSWIYGFLGGAVFPMEETSLPVSNAWYTRFLAQLLLSVMTASFLALASRASGREQGRPPGTLPTGANP